MILLDQLSLPLCSTIAHCQTRYSFHQNWLNKDRSNMTCELLLLGPLHRSLSFVFTTSKIANSHFWFSFVSFCLSQDSYYSKILICVYPSLLKTLLSQYLIWKKIAFYTINLHTYLRVPIRNSTYFKQLRFSSYRKIFSSSPPFSFAMFWRLFASFLLKSADITTSR